MIQIKVGDLIVFETKNAEDFDEWIKINNRLWTPASTPYLERSDGKRFDILRGNLGYCSCNSCLATGIDISEVEQHICKEWWSETT